MSEYGETLARYRDDAGLNQRELGAAIGLDYTQLNKIEHGHRPPLRAKYMKPLVRALRLEKSQAEKLVDLAGLSRKVLDFMVEEGGMEEEEQVISRSDLDRLAATGTFRAPSSLVDNQGQQPLTFEEQARQILTSANLPYAKRMIAQQMILESIRIICLGLKEASE
jgi:transcriptional regulator with XRE-family HTH domain